MKTFLALVFLSFKFCNVFAEAPPQGQLSVEGKKLLGNGKPVALHGMSLFQSNFEEGIPFYDEQVVKALECQWNSNVVRAAMGIDDGAEAYLQGPEPEKTQKGRVEKVIKAAIDAGIYVIVDWHTHNALNQEVKELKVYQQKIVDAIRAIDPENLILIGTPTYSQGVDTASKNKLTGKNICYALHFYAGSHKEDVRKKAKDALDNLGVDERLTPSGSLVKKHLLGQDNGVKCDGSSTGSTSPASTSPTSNGPK
uniref:Glycoside hydrolase family 5 domain-containing protein n=1 Tax=Meloidogyne floridensis TaxID=298350 RepID=A0A915NSQ4_9BILA